MDLLGSEGDDFSVSELIRMTPKQGGVTLFIPDKVDVKPKLFRRKNEGHFILEKLIIYQKEIIIININLSPKFIQQTLLDLGEQMNHNTMIVSDFKISL
jgi:hypothetical protein